MWVSGIKLVISLNSRHIYYWVTWQAFVLFKLTIAKNNLDFPPYMFFLVTPLCVCVSACMFRLTVDYFIVLSPLQVYAIMPCSSGCPGTCSVNKASLELRDLPAYVWLLSARIKGVWVWYHQIEFIYRYLYMLLYNIYIIYLYTIYLYKYMHNIHKYTHTYEHRPRVLWW